MITPEILIQHFNLKELPVEGGLYCQTYRSLETILSKDLPPRYQIDKPFGTAIIYLYTNDPDSFSAMHTLPTDEIYHFYMGDPVEFLQLYEDGKSERVILGHDILNGQLVQHIVPKECWQGSHLLPGGQWALIGTTMAPGFTFEDYLGGGINELVLKYPGEANLIRQLTRPVEPLIRSY
jgi:predicted cupin superfamily sugar epimerase